MSLKNNRYISIFKIKLINKGPMKIGNDEGGILLDYVTNNPYLPGTSVAGAIKSYSSKVYGKKKVENLFGNGDKESKVYIGDSYANNKKEIEYRPGVRINNELGINEKGGYFERELLGEGHIFEVEIKLYSKDSKEKEEEIKILKSAFSAINTGELRFGANKSNGSGVLEVNKLEVVYLDLEKAEDLIKYLQNTYSFKDSKEQYLKEGINEKTVKFSFKGETATPLLIKGQSTLNHKLPDGANMINNNGEYILPGTSFKGALRNLFNKIAKIKDIEEVTEIAFGQDAKSDNKKAGRLYFKDIKIENSLDKAIYNRIKIDLFTGGIREGAILNEKPIKGKFESEIYYKLTDNEDIDNKVIAIMLFTLKDALTEEISFGSGNSIGRGKLKGDYIKIEVNNKSAIIDLINNKHQNKEMISEIISNIN